MTLSAQMRVLTISAGCPTVEKIAVFRDRKWDSPESGNPVLNFKVSILFIQSPSTDEIVGSFGAAQHI